MTGEEPGAPGREQVFSRGREVVARMTALDTEWRQLDRERQDIVQWLNEVEHMTVRAIAAGIGISKSRVGQILKRRPREGL